VQLEPETLVRLGHIEVASHEAKPEDIVGNANANGNGNESAIAEVRFAPIRKGLLGLDNFGFEADRDAGHRNPPRRFGYRDVQDEDESEMREREHRRRSASSPGPGPPEVSVSFSQGPLPAAKARTRGLTISELRPRGGVESAGSRGGSGAIRPGGRGKAQSYEVGEAGEVQQENGEGGQGGVRVEDEDEVGDGNDQDLQTARVPLGPGPGPAPAVAVAVGQAE
jgi:hypothetical protein